MERIEITESLLIQALKVYQGRRLELLTEAEEISKRHVFSTAFNARMDKLVRLQKKSYYFFINSMTKKVALVFLLILITIFSTVFSIKALRDPAINFIVHVYEKMSTIIFGDGNGNDVSLPAFILEYYEPGYLPEGLVLKVTEDFRMIYRMKYANENGLKLDFDQFTVRTTRMTIDTEGTTYENIEINGNQGIYYSNKGRQHFIWNDGVYGFQLSSKLPKEELRKIAESVKKRE